jgi:short-subunit dehydrogenase
MKGIDVYNSECFFKGDKFMASNTRPLAVVTGASSGIGYELAKLCAENGFDLVVAADRPLEEAVGTLRGLGAEVESVEADLATPEGVDRLYEAIGGRPVDALLANAGHGLGRAFLDQDFDEVRHVIDTNITGTVYLIQKVGRDMRARGQGRILITGSIAGFMPGSFQAVYNGTKAFIDSFSFALRNELKETEITVTCLMPGATDTEFFERADMLDTKVGTQEKDDPAKVARDGFDAMMAGEGDVVSGWSNKIQTTLATVTPAGVLAEQHRKMAEPGTAEEPAGEKAAGKSKGKSKGKSTGSK